MPPPDCAHTVWGTSAVSDQLVPPAGPRALCSGACGGAGAHRLRWGWGTPFPPSNSKWSSRRTAPRIRETETLLLYHRRAARTRRKVVNSERLAKLSAFPRERGTRPIRRRCNARGAEGFCSGSWPAAGWRRCWGAPLPYSRRLPSPWTVSHYQTRKQILPRHTARTRRGAHAR